MNFIVKKLKWAYVQRFLISICLLYLWIDKLFISKQTSLLLLIMLTIISASYCGIVNIKRN
jgi:hypothetical protein